MKKEAFISTIIFFLVSSFAFATEGRKGKKAKKETAKAEASVAFNAEIHKRHSGLIAVHFEKPSNEKVEIRITDSDGTVIHNEFKKKNDKAVMFYDLSEKSSGKYLFEVIKGDEVIRKEISTK